MKLSADQLPEQVCEHMSLFRAHYAPFPYLDGKGLKTYLVNPFRFSDFYVYKSLGDSLLSVPRDWKGMEEKVNFR